MALPYFNCEDLYRYLNNTICTYRGDYVYVTVANRYDTNAEMKVRLWPLPLKDFSQKNFTEIDHRDPEFNDRALPLGYLNWNTNAFYLERMPYRRQHHALQSATIMGHPRSDYESQWFTSQEMLNMLKGIYPSIKEARANLADGYEAVALHRHIALRRISRSTCFLNYRGDAIGTVGPEGITYFDSPKRELIKKIIERTGVL